MERISSYLVCLCVWSALNTSHLSHRLIGPDEGVWRAAPTHSCPVDHVVSRWAGNTGGASLGGAQGAAATLWGHASEQVGDVDGVDLCNISTVSPLLMEEKHEVSISSCFAGSVVVCAAEAFLKWSQSSRLPSGAQRNNRKNSFRNI